uniref:Cyclic nucleotide-binding domain-containing protein n=1 Tax=Chromera velia CCMP2878 TaxID=1169474 RepID=A0A0G4HJP1_9ALVE|eukprot:Cvel_7125.t1-p1 / transcript=Cvel_7125.t1 / gene=Cvel_7125 / organism=Chromera_velia_CCMP2878 / gene_product=cAMP-dependent protein kinase regulatory subunit, putative / transcript_product=cAMP-dependent protein kinase regulatory subunit, putative / location=Cvel_scaffold365:77243-88706(+) / protein_length=1139 / sequence_SO=supercontig / SO=protein_coding / is_pseudo=false
MKTTIPKAKKADKYFQEHQVQQLLTGMLVQLGKQTPAKPVHFMIDYLKKLAPDYEAGELSPSTQADSPQAKPGGTEEGAPASSSGPVQDDSQVPLSKSVDFSRVESKMEVERQDSNQPGEMTPQDGSQSPSRSPSRSPSMNRSQSFVPRPRKRRENVFDMETFDDHVPPVYEKPEEAQDFISRTLGKNCLFAEVDNSEEEILINAFYEVKVEQGDVVIRQGESGDLYYILESGTCNCFVKKPEWTPPAEGEEAGEWHAEFGPKVFRYDKRGMAFGELALMYNAPRAATIVCDSEERAKLWALDRKTFKKILADSARQDRKKQLEFVERFEMFSELSQFEKLRVLEAVTAVWYEDGDRIIQQGDEGYELFIIEEGECKAVKDDGSGEETECFRRLGPGDYFGELALLTSAPRAASVDAVTAVKCYRLEAEAFERLLGPLSGVLGRNKDQYTRWMAKLKNAGLDAREGNQMLRQSSYNSADSGLDEEEGEASFPVQRVERVRRDNVWSEGVEEDPNWTPPVHEKSEEERKFLSEALEKNALLKHVVGEAAEKVVIDAVEKKEFAKGEVVIQQGADGDVYYILESGTCNCFVKKPEWTPPAEGEEAGEWHPEFGPKVFRYDKRGMAFGELALMYNAPRAATIVCDSEEGAKLWALDRKTFKQSMFTQSKQERGIQMASIESFPMFNSLSKFEKLSLLEAMKSKKFAPGERIIQQGDIGKELFMIEQGEAKCILKSEAGEEVECFRRLTAGDHFGELALLRSAPRAVSVDAVEETRVFSLEEHAFRRLLGPIQDILRRDMGKYTEWMYKFGLSEEEEEEDEASPKDPSQVVSNRRRDVVMGEKVEEDPDFVPPVHEKSEDDEAFLKEALSKSLLFKHLGPQESSIVVGAFAPAVFNSGDPVIKQGDDGDHFYVLASGTCNCFVKPKEWTPPSDPPADAPPFHPEFGPRVFRYDKQGMTFGELALMYNAPRAATIVCDSEEGTKLWALDRKTFKQVLLKTRKQQEETQMKFINEFPLFSTLDKEEKMRVLEAVKVMEFSAGTRVVLEGSTDCDLFYMIVEGECVPKKANEQGEEVPVFRNLKTGEYFGELALLNNKPRAASVDCVTDCILYCIDRRAFTRLLGPLEEILKRNSEVYATWKAEME